MSPPAPSVTVRVPGSTSNCGSGFDTLGLALDLHNRVSLAPAPGSDPVPERPADARAQPMAAAAAAAFFRAAGLPPAGFRYRIEGEVPSARGLGSSATILAGVLAGLDALHRARLGRSRLVGLVADLEGHPDNAGACVLGGFCVSRCDPATGAYLDTIRLAVPAELRFAVASPGAELNTKDSRGALPAALPYFDAVKGINAAAYLVAAFATGDFARLRHAGGDPVHEPYRLPRIPGAGPAIAAGVAAGAYTGWLSGSGSSVLCVCPAPEAGRILEAMTVAFAAAGVRCEGRVAAADNGGLALE